MSRVLICRSKFYGNQFLNAEATIFLSPSAPIRLCCFLGSSQLIEEFTRGSGWVGLHSEHTHAQLKASALSFTAINSHKNTSATHFCNLPEDRGTQRMGPGECKAPCMARQGQRSSDAAPCSKSITFIPFQPPPGFRGAKPAACEPRLYGWDPEDDPGRG